ncbi:MAG: signal peptidase II [Spirochaetia bacterium]
MKQRILAVFFITIVLLNFGIDRITKYAAEEHLQGEGRIQVVGDIAVLVYAENQGAFLGMGSDLPQPYRLLLLTILPTVFIFGFLIYILVKEKLNVLQYCALATVMGGGLGNLWDRIFRNGLVVDFMNFGIANLRTGILNVADLSLTFGAVVLLVSMYFSKKQEPDN